MDLTEASLQVFGWQEAFFQRFPGTIEADGEPRSKLLLILYILDAGRILRFSVSPNGEPVVAVKEFATVLGVEPKWLSGLAISQELALNLDFQYRFRQEADGAMEPWLTLAGLVIVSHSVPPDNVSTREAVGRLAAVHALLDDLAETIGASFDVTAPWDLLITARSSE